MPSPLRIAGRLLLAALLLAVAPPPGPSAAAVELPKAAPFSGVTLAGERVTRETMFRGNRYVVLVFFGVSCIPCQKKMAQLNECWANPRFREKARIYAVNTDGLDPVKLGQEMERRNIRVEYPVICDEKQAITDLFVDGVVPLTVVIDNQDRIVLSLLGARPESLRKLENHILTGQETSTR